MLLRPRPSKPHGLTGQQSSETPVMFQVTPTPTGGRVTRFGAIATPLDPAVDGSQVGALHRRRCDREAGNWTFMDTMRTAVTLRKTSEMAE